MSRPGYHTHSHTHTCIYVFYVSVSFLPRLQKICTEIHLDLRCEFFLQATADLMLHIACAFCCWFSGYPTAIKIGSEGAYAVGSRMRRSLLSCNTF